MRGLLSFLLNFLFQNHYFTLILLTSSPFSSGHPFSQGILFLRASFFSGHPFSQGILFLRASFFSGHPFSQGYTQAKPQPSVKDCEPENSHQKAAC
ncbi:hypothetical protein MSWH1_1928 [Methanosarcina sp. WH1]|nr:hypothetical protein MSWH1_1928 [Methanosarcina sp. WH1]